MPEVESRKDYLTLAELCALTGFAPATVHRWKDSGRIPYFQPGGKGGRIKFPPNAIEVCRPHAVSPPPEPPPPESRSEHRHGPTPKWMKSGPK